MKRYIDVPGDGGSDIVSQVTEKIGILRERTGRIRYKVAVMSGKGGVGKSTVTLGLASALAEQGLRVGVLDADLNGPSLSRMMHMDEAVVQYGPSGVEPAEAFGLKAMSIAFFLDSPERHLKWKGPSETYPWVSTFEATALRELLSDTNWGDLDFLLIDLPPGHTRFNDLRGLLPDLDGVVMVTIPSDASNLIVLKSINMVREAGSPIVGVVENMKGFACAHCGGHNDLFSGEEIRAAFEYAGVPYLGTVPFESALSDTRRCLSRGDWGLAQAAFVEIVEKLLAFCQGEKKDAIGG